MKPTKQHTPEELRAILEELAAEKEGAFVWDAPYEEVPGFRLRVPGEAELRYIVFPERLCSLSYEVKGRSTVTSSTIDRFLASFRLTQ